MMAERIPDGITAEHLIKAIRRIENGIRNRFAESTGYDVLFEGKRFAPKAVVGVAAAEILGEELGPYDFKGGLHSKCFYVLEVNGFTIVTKGGTDPFPEELNEQIQLEGGWKEVKVNKFERDATARAKCIEHYGVTCQVCGFNFEETYGKVGEGFIHVHHIVPLANIGREYEVNPIEDLRPVCPNCHAMLHKKQPPFTIDELKHILEPTDEELMEDDV